MLIYIYIIYIGYSSATFLCNYKCIVWLACLFSWECRHLQFGRLPPPSAIGWWLPTGQNHLGKRCQNASNSWIILYKSNSWQVTVLFGLALAMIFGLKPVYSNSKTGDGKGRFYHIIHLGMYHAQAPAVHCYAGLLEGKQPKCSQYPSMIFHADNADSSFCWAGWNSNLWTSWTSQHQI